MPELVESKYKFEDVPNGFNITGPNRKPTFVRFNGLTFNCLSAEWLGSQNPWISGFGMFEFGKLIQKIAGNLMDGWQPKPTPNGKHPYKLVTWAKTQTAKALSKKVNARRLALLEKADPRHVQAQRNYYACCGKFHSNLLNKGLYEESNKFILADICKYRAAAMTVEDMQFDRDGYFKGWQTRGSEDFHGRYGYYDNWMAVYSHGHIPSGPLRKTLMNLPGGIPYRMLKDIADEELERPYLNRLELLTYLCVSDYREDMQERNRRIVNRSTADQIRKAIRMIYTHWRQEETSIRKVAAISNALRYIFDCTEEHHGHIVGMADKSIRWHRAGRYADEARYCKHSPDTLTKHPTIEMPKEKGIRFLDTVQSVFDESVAMSHCVSGYAGKAVKGDCYLFHIDYRENCATVEVSPRGYVVQSHGPHNNENVAAKWGKRVLDKWAQKMAPLLKRVHDEDDNPAPIEELFAEMPF